MAALKPKPLLQILLRLAGSPKTPVVGFGLGLLAAIWVGYFQILSSEYVALQRAITQDAANLAIVIDQNISRSVGEVDRLLKSLRRTYEQNGYEADWPRLIQDDFTLNDERVQIVVIGADGVMVTSTSMLYPAKPLDLSDREHFFVHARTTADELYISKPVFGRATKRWTIQFTRRLSGPDGSFQGVLVISTDPVNLSQIYGGLALGEGGGLAVIGTDGIVRAGTGTYQSWAGRGFQEGNLIEATLSPAARSSVTYQSFRGSKQIVANRQLETYPLNIAVSAPDVAARSDWKRKQVMYLSSALVLSLLVGLAMAAMIETSQRHQAEIVRLARNDPLTGLANRLAFDEQLSIVHKSIREGQNFALHLIDLDGFKSVNDTYGHPFGDKLLQAVARRLLSNLRLSDFTARLGGDEFAILQSNIADEESAARLAQRMCAELGEPYEIEGIRVSIGASIGIALGRTDGRTVTQLLSAGDLALYSAKVDGRDRYKFYSEEMNATAAARRKIEEDLRQALQTDQFEVHYQPINSIATGAVTAYEALVRWRHPVRGLVQPGEFIPVAEETGLIVKVGELVLRSACKEMARRTGNCKIAVNFSPIQFKDDNLVALVEDALRISGLAPNRLEIEITESTLMQRDNRTISHLQALRELGVQIAMDDFGTGYSSLSYLQSYPINCIKIDRSFVSSIGERDGSLAIIKAITSLANDLKMSTIAEGVETREQLDALKELGCMEAQGYYFSRPLPAHEILPPLAAEPREAVPQAA